MTEREHGTYATWNWHRYHRVPMCEACREAARIHQAEWRAKNPEGRKRERRNSGAHSRALWRLARLYPAEFQALVAEERQKGTR